MAAPVYFFPDRRLSPDFVKPGGEFRREYLYALNLDRIFGDIRHIHELAYAEVPRGGPANAGGGVCLAITPAIGSGGTLPQGGLISDGQEWIRRERENGQVYYVGIRPDDPPRPCDVLRPGGAQGPDGPLPKIPGEDVEFGDGNLWHVPLIRRPNGETNLPVVMGWDEKDRPRQEIDPEYFGLWNATSVLLEIFDADRETPIDVAQVMELVAQGLSCNYRLDHALISRLRLFNSDAVKQAAGVMVDFDFYAEGLRRAVASRQKKMKRTTDASGSVASTANTLAGCGASTPDTVPAAAN